jgi:hypothetical protein
MPGGLCVGARRALASETMGRGTAVPRKPVEMKGHLLGGPVSGRRGKARGHNCLRSRP